MELNNRTETVPESPVGRTPIYLLTGFLGSGKTTLLRNLAALYQGRRIGIIVNEFGELGIDGSLLHDSTGIITTELNGGQIFCSCLSGSFIESIATYRDKQLDVLFVEASGLAKPAPLMEIMHIAEEEADDVFRYSGMICVLDASRFSILSETLMTLEEQMSYSDAFIVNKTDLAESSEIENVLVRIQQLRPGAKTITTEYCKIDRDFLDQVHMRTEDELTSIDKELYAGWGETGRPKPVKLIPAAAVVPEKLSEFISAMTGKTFRMKGYVSSTDSTILFVDCVGESVSITVYQGEDKDIPLGIVLIFPGDSKETAKVFRNWKTITGTGAFVST